MSKRLVIQICSLVIAIVAGSISVFITTMSGFNFFLYIATGGKEWPAYIFVFVVFLLVSFFVFRKLNKLLQNKFVTNQSKSAT